MGFYEIVGRMTVFVGSAFLYRYLFWGLLPWEDSKTEERE